MHILFLQLMCNDLQCLHQGYEMWGILMVEFHERCQAKPRLRRLFYTFVPYFQTFQILKWKKKFMAAIFEPLFTQLKPATYQSQHLSQC